MKKLRSFVVCKSHDDKVWFQDQYLIPLSMVTEAYESEYNNTLYKITQKMSDRFRDFFGPYDGLKVEDWYEEDNLDYFRRRVLPTCACKIGKEEIDILESPYIILSHTKWTVNYQECLRNCLKVIPFLKLEFRMFKEDSK